MKIYFSVNSPKLEKRKINRGEDAPVVNKDGIMIICDGTGATGQEEHTISGEIYTSAYLGARETSKIAEDFLLKNYERLIDSFTDKETLQKIIVELGKTIRDSLTSYVQKNNLTLTVHGKSFKLLPTTFTAVIYKTYETKTETIVLSAGDSRALWWDSLGLHQLSLEDGNNNPISTGDCSVSNCISADGDFKISYSCYSLPPKGILLTTSDGFTDPIKPFDQERYLIEWIGNFDNISSSNSDKLAEEIAQNLDNIGFTGRDDCSIAGVIVGYKDNEIKDDFRKRYKEELIEFYLKPNKELNSKYRYAEDNLKEAKKLLLESENQAVELIKNGILAFIKNNTQNLSDDALFQLLINSDTIGGEIRKENNLIENDRKDKTSIYTKKRLELRNGYLEFLKALCKDFGHVRFSDELIAVVTEYYEAKYALEQYSQSINKELSALKRLSDANAKIVNSAFINELEALTEKLSFDLKLAKSICQKYEKNKEIIEGYFSYENEEIVRFYKEDIESNFSVLKKISKLPTFLSNRRNELKIICQSLLRLYETILELKEQTNDAFIQKKKFTAYSKTIMRFSKEISRELFYKDKYWDFMPQDLTETNLPNLVCYKQAKDEVQSLLAQRNNLVNHYGQQYEKYLLNASIRGNIIFENEGYK